MAPLGIHLNYLFKAALAGWLATGLSKQLWGNNWELAFWPGCCNAGCGRLLPTYQTFLIILPQGVILVEKMATKSIHHFTLQPLRLNLGIRKMNAKLHTRPQKRANWPLCKRKNIFCSKWYKIVVLIKILWGWLNFSACSIYCYITLKKKKNYY